MYQWYQKRMGLYPVPESAVEDAIRHARDVYPEESCGYVANNVYVRCRNVSDSPLDTFMIDPSEYQDAMIGNQIQAIMHSHPDGLEGPTKDDMESQREWAIPWGIVVMQDRQPLEVLFFGDQVKRAPLEGRPFKPGIYDCYSCGRDYYKTLGIDLPDFPREPNWWRDNDKNYLTDNFASVGFDLQIDYLQLQRNDVILGKLQREMPVSHCGVYLGDGLMLHHLAGSQQRPRLSRIEPLAPWKAYITHYLRYTR